MIKKKDFISKAELGALPKALVSCLQDKAPKIRGMTELVIIEVLPHTGPAGFKKILKDLKPAVANTVKPIIMKCIDEANIGDEKGDDAPPAKSKGAKKSDTPDKALPAALTKSRAPKDKKERPKTAAPMTAQAIHEKLNKKPMGIGGKKKGGDELVFQILEPGRKDKRNEADKKKRWHPEEIRGDYIEKFKHTVKNMFGDTFAAKMFATDFKQLVKCIKAIKEVFDNEEMFDPFLDVIDVIIKWAYIKSNEISNISFLKELYTFFDEIIDFLIERDYQFLEAEGNIFCICLVEKISMNNNIMKEKIKEIIMKVGKSTVYYPKKLMGLLVKSLSSKNTKQVAE